MIPYAFFVEDDILKKEEKKKLLKNFESWQKMYLILKSFI